MCYLDILRFPNIKMKERSEFSLDQDDVLIFAKKINDMIVTEVENLERYLGEISIDCTRGCKPGMRFGEDGISVYMRTL